MVSILSPTINVYHGFVGKHQTLFTAQFIIKSKKAGFNGASCQMASSNSKTIWLQKGLYLPTTGYWSQVVDVECRWQRYPIFLNRRF